MNKDKTPPPNISPLPSTPIHVHSVTTSKFGPKYEARKDVLCHLSDEMSHFIVGPMPPQDFLDKFMGLPKDTLLPLPTFENNMFSSLPGLPLENAMYYAFVHS